MDSLKYYICSMHQDFFMPRVLIFSYNGFQIPSTHEEKLISLVLTDGIHLVKEKSSIALKNFYNWILQVEWRAYGASRKLITPLWKNGSLLDHGKCNKIDFVGPSDNLCSFQGLRDRKWYTCKLFRNVHFGLYDVPNSQMDFFVDPEAFPFVQILASHPVHLHPRDFLWSTFLSFVEKSCDTTNPVCTRSMQ